MEILTKSQVVTPHMFVEMTTKSSIYHDVKYELYLARSNPLFIE